MSNSPASSLWKDGICLGSTFFGGVLGNLAASLAWEAGKFLLQPLIEKVPTLSEVLVQGGKGKNHDLLRALRTAECDALIEIIDVTLLDDFGLRSGKGPISERLATRLRERKEPAIAVLCQMRRSFREQASKIGKMPIVDLGKFRVSGTDALDVSEIVASGRETLHSANPDALREQATSKYLRALESSIRPQALPAEFQKRFCAVECGWFSLMRVSFREELKVNERSRVAFELDCQSLLPDLLGKGFADIVERLTEQDKKLSSVLGTVGEFRAGFDDAVNSLAETLDEIAATTAGTHSLVEELHAQIVGKPEKKEPKIPEAIQTELDRGDKLDGECKYAEARAAYETAAKMAESAGDMYACIKARIELAEVLTREELDIARAKEVLTVCFADLKSNPLPKLRATALHLLGHIELCQGRINEGKSLCREALQSAIDRGDRFQQGNFLISVAHAEEMSGNLSEAHRLLDEAAENFRAEYREDEGRDRAKAGINLAGCHSMKALVYEHQGKVVEMLVCLTEAERLLREHSHADNLGRTLITKCRALFASGKWEVGLKSLDEAHKIFEEIGNISWLLRCFDIRARLAFQRNNPTFAISVCLGACEVAKDKGHPEDYVKILGKTGALCRMNGMSEAAAKFHAEAKRLANEHSLSDLLVDLILDEAAMRRGEDEKKEDDEEGKRLVREALEHLETLLLKTEVKGRRAVLMNRIGSLYGRLGNLVDARTWVERALENFEEIGDEGGVADSLASLAATAREEKDLTSAIRLFESLLERAKGKPFQHFQAGAHHDLVQLKISQDDLVGARGHFDQAKAICAGYPMPDVEEALRETSERLEWAERSRKAPPRDLNEMLRELHAWKDLYPQVAEAILPFWYYCYGAEATSNVRSAFGVKFLVRAESTAQFEAFGTAWVSLGELFIYAASFAVRSEAAIDLFPFSRAMLIPPNLHFAGFKKLPPESEERGKAMTKAIVEALGKVPYFLTLFDGTLPEFPGAKVFVVGRRARVPKDIWNLMLGSSADDLIASKLVVMPVGERYKDDSFMDDMGLAHETGTLPVFFGQLRHSGEATLVRTAQVLFPKSPAEACTKAKQSLTRFMSEVGTNPDGALAGLMEGLSAALTVGANGALSATLYIFRFKNGPKLVTHPALVLSC